MGYIYANKLNKPGGKPVKIGGKSHKVNRSEGKALGGEVTEEEPELTRGKAKGIVRRKLRESGDYRRGPSRRTARRMVKSMGPEGAVEDVNRPRNIEEGENERLEEMRQYRATGNISRKSGGLVGKLRHGGLDEKIYPKTAKTSTDSAAYAMGREWPEEYDRLGGGKAGITLNPNYKKGLEDKKKEKKKLFRIVEGFLEKKEA